MALRDSIPPAILIFPSAYSVFSVLKLGRVDAPGNTPSRWGQESCWSCCTLSQTLHNLLHICLQVLAF